MKFGFCVPNLTDGDDLKKFAVAVETLGFESIWWGDHLYFQLPVPISIHIVQMVHITDL